MYKTKLQQLCHKKRWDLPIYSYVQEGPDHIPCFNASAVLNGVTFQTTSDFTSSKSAKNDAARLAFHYFTHLNDIDQYKLLLQTYARRNKALIIVEGDPYESPGSYKTWTEAENTLQEINDSLYKNILQELAHSEGFILPIYETKSSGEPHDPSFISTVEVEGETFQGTTAKTKKQAEFNAARAAYTAFMERRRSRTANSSSSSSAYEALEVKPGSVIPTPPDLSSLSIGGS